MATTSSGTPTGPTSTTAPASSVTSPPVSPTSDTTTSTTSTTTTTTSTSDTSTTTTTTSNTDTTTDTTTSATDTSTSTTTSSTNTTTALTTAPPTTLSSTSTSTFESTSLLTSNGQTFTTVVVATTVIQPGSVITPSSVVPSNSNRTSSSNTGAIVGGVVGGVGGILLVLLGVWFFLKKRRSNKDDFDGNFDPAHVGKGGGGGTLPQMDVDDDDGVGGRLATGAEGGGIISPYAYNPSGAGVQPSMSQSTTHPPLGALGAAAGVGAAALYADGQSTHGGPTSTSSYYPGTASSEAGGPTSPITSAGASEGGYGGPGTATTSSSGGYYPGGANGYAPPTGRGPSPGPSMQTGAQGGSSEHSSSGYGGAAAGLGAAGAAGAMYAHGHNPRSAKEMEALGMRGPAGQPRVMNPDDQGGPSYYSPNPYQPQQPTADQAQARRQSYLQHGPGGHYYSPAEGATASGLPDALRPGMPVQRAGSAVVVHQDGGRVVMSGKGREALEEEPGEGSQMPEIPPTYDSLVTNSGRAGDGEARGQ